MVDIKANYQQIIIRPRYVLAGPPDTGTTDHLALNNIGTLSHAALEIALSVLTSEVASKEDQGVAAQLIANLLGAADPFVQYLLESDTDAAISSNTDVAASKVHREITSGDPHGTTHADLPDKGVSTHAVIDTDLATLAELFTRTTGNNSGDQDVTGIGTNQTAIEAINTLLALPDPFTQYLLAGMTSLSINTVKDYATLNVQPDVDKNALALLYPGNDLYGFMVRVDSGTGELTIHSMSSGNVAADPVIKIGRIKQALGVGTSPAAKVHVKGYATATAVIGKFETDDARNRLQIDANGVRVGGSFSEESERKITGMTDTTTVDDLYIIVDPALNSILLTIHAPTLLPGQWLRIIFPYGYVGTNTVTYQGTMETTGSQLLPGDELWIRASALESKWLGD